jgi:hypothetical protein
MYTRDERTGRAMFHFVRAPTREDIAAVARQGCERVCRMLRRRGLVAQPSHESNESKPVEAALDWCREAARSRGHFERVDEQGSSQPPLFPDEYDARLERRRSSPFAAEHEGFSVHAGVSFGALDRKGRERLVHYCVRPPVALGRLSILRDGSVAIGSCPTFGCP